MSNKALNWAFAQDIKSGPKLVLIAIADKLLHRGSCLLSIKKIQKLTSISSNRTILDHIFYLEDLGLIKREIHSSNNYKRGGRGETCFIIPHFQSAESTLSNEEKRLNQSADFANQSAESTHQYPITHKPNKEKNNKKEKFTPPPGISQEAADEFIQHRRNLKKPLTQNAFNRAMVQALKASQEIGITPDEAIHETIDAGWQGIKAEWLKNRLRKNHVDENRTRKSTSEIAHDNLNEIYAEITGRKDCLPVQDSQPDVRADMGFTIEGQNHHADDDLNLDGWLERIH